MKTVSSETYLTVYSIVLWRHNVVLTLRSTVFFRSCLYLQIQVMARVTIGVPVLDQFESGSSKDWVLPEVFVFVFNWRLLTLQ